VRRLGHDVGVLGSLRHSVHDAWHA
jgi:hypothetical protein